MLVIQRQKCNSRHR